MNIVITGASSGVGYQAALNLSSSAKNSVIAIARSADKLVELRNQSIKNNASYPIINFPFDIVQGDYDNALLPFIKSQFDYVDVLVNNAGALINKPFSSLSSEDFNEMINANFTGHVNMIHALLRLMKKGGHILNIGSMGGYQGSVKFPGLSAYSATKAALHVLTECLAAELIESNIKVNCLALGSAQTEMLEKAFPGYQSPLSAKEMGAFIADFAVNGNKYFNGKILPVSVSTP